MWRRACTAIYVYNVSYKTIKGYILIYDFQRSIQGKHGVEQKPSKVARQAISIKWRYKFVHNFDPSDVNSVENPRN